MACTGQVTQFPVRASTNIQPVLVKITLLIQTKSAQIRVISLEIQSRETE